MQAIRSVNEMQSFAISRRTQGKLLGLVPTMGALHEGHQSLIRIAVEQADCSIVSIFVNPTQFGPNEDLANYPRQLEEDLAICEQLGVDVVFCPPVEEIYPPDHSTYVEETSVSKDLCAITRPQHFRGVATVCSILFNIVRPDFAVFGQKDAQQCAVIRKMVSDLHLPVEVVVGPTVREPDGLAMSSRNRYLTPEQRADARVIHQSLRKAEEMVAGGIHNVDRILAEVLHILGGVRRIRIIYAALVDSHTMKPLRELKPGRSVLAVACWVDQVRLIDNVVL